MTARAAIYELTVAGIELVIVLQVLYEFWAVVTRPTADNGLGLSPEIAAGEIENFKAAFASLHDTPPVFSQWERLALAYSVRGKQAHGLTHLLTFNSKHFCRFTTGEGIAVVGPANLPKSKKKTTRKAEKNRRRDEL